MGTISRWFSQIQVYLVWLLGFALTLVILALLHELIMLFIVNTLNWDRDTVRFANMLYYIPAGLATLAYIVFTYQFLTRTMKRSGLKKSMLLLGSQLLVIGLIQFGLVGYRYLQASSLNLLLAISEALAGAAFLYFAYRQPNPHTG